jgi:SAM-dependent methyltransferase
MEVRESVRRYYGERISNDRGCCKVSLDSELVEFENGVDVPSYGCGNPTVFADLQKGETVLDLGSGAGLDCFRAAVAVGPEGRVVGVDMTPQMLKRASSGAKRLGLANVEFRQGYIERLPIDSDSVDVVISNCVINLSPDKPAVFSDAARVLKPGGRLIVSDILRLGKPQAAVTEDGWCACIDGAETSEDYRSWLEGAGLKDINIEPAAPPANEGETFSALVRATKPRLNTEPV